jgi:hypothetical protein
MKKSLFIVSILFFGLTLLQAQNPYEALGIEEQVLHYDDTHREVFGDDSIKAIGYGLYSPTLGLIAICDLNDSLITVERIDPSKVARWVSVDPLATEYTSWSPYNYTLGSPIQFIDPDGREIWIAYGNNQKVKWEGGKLLNIDGTLYDGNDPFVNNVSTSLNLMNSVIIGQKVLDQLSVSNNVFEFQNTFPTNQNGEPIENALTFSGNSNGGGIIKAGALGNEFMQEQQKIGSTGHELFHGYQQELGETGATINREVGAYLYEHALISTLGQTYEGFGIPGTTAGENYETAMYELLYGDSFSQTDYQNALDNFKQGSPKNVTGIYNNFTIESNDPDPVIKQFTPLIRN